MVVNENTGEEGSVFAPLRIVVLGGYGVFGSRISEMLVDDGHDVVIIGRDVDRAVALSKVLGCSYRVLDFLRSPEDIFEVSPDLVVNAAGPFYEGIAGYELVRLCIEARVHWFDLAEDASWVEGISSLNEEAREAGVVVLSGVSSVPALSSCVVQSLCHGMDRIESIETAIVPGNQAPRGRMVLESILEQMGTSFQVMREGSVRFERVWTSPQRIDLGEGMRRDAYLIEVPDTKLFPEYFDVPTVLFRAGLDLSVLNKGMWGVSWIREKMPFSWPGWVVSCIHWGANKMIDLGSDVGGMEVKVQGIVSQRSVERRWVLVAREGQGPYVPGIMVRCLARSLSSLGVGARPALCEVSLSKVEPCWGDKRVDAFVKEKETRFLFESALSENWELLDGVHQESHRVRKEKRFSGVSRVLRGRGFLASIIGSIFNFPGAGEKVPVKVIKRVRDGKEHWVRIFDGREFSSVLEKGPEGCVKERFGPFKFTIALVYEDGVLSFVVKDATVLGLSLPRFLMPDSGAKEWVEEGLFHFDVWIKAPFSGETVVRYRGILKEELDMPLKKFDI